MPDTDPKANLYDWNHRERIAIRLPPEFDDETLRDGLQSPSVVQPPIEDRLAILRSLVPLGIHAADIGLPGSGVDHYNASLALASAIVNERLPIDANCACRTVPAEIDKVAEVQQATGRSIEAAMFLGGSRIRGVVEGWDKERLLQTTITAVDCAIRHGLRVMFVTEDTTRMHPDDISAIYRAAVEHGATRVCLSDTVGYADPYGAAELVRYVRQVLGPTIKIDWHGHNDRGLAVANALAAYAAGANRLHGTAMGIGERSGNCPMDTLLVNLRLSGEINNDLSTLPAYVHGAAQSLGVPVPIGFPVVGADAFRTGTGVHAAALIKARPFGNAVVDAIYSGVPAAWVGREQEIIITTLSGRNGIRAVLQGMGLPHDDATVERVFNTAKAGDRRLNEAQIRQAAVSE